jgi:CxxC-x17-CxxC domain-containing protein
VIHFFDGSSCLSKLGVNLSMSVKIWHILKEILDSNTLVIIEKNLRWIMSQDRKMYKCTCSDCKKETEVPFEPKADRPVYCKECYQKNHQK